MLVFYALNPINVQIKNNIFYKISANLNHSLLSFTSNSSLTGVTLDNNLYYFPNPSGNIIRVANNNYTTLTSFKSIYPTYELNGQQGNPNFVAAPNDFHLTSSSTLAVDKGADLTGVVNLDIEGMRRPLDGDGKNGPSWDIGPYEYCCFPVGVESFATENEILIYPNPTNGEITISTSDQTPHKIIIADISGRIMLETNTSSPKNTFNLINLQNGLYFVNIFMKSGFHKIEVFVKVR